jgi:hypothetical protein
MLTVSAPWRFTVNAEMAWTIYPRMRRWLLGIKRHPKLLLATLGNSNQASPERLVRPPLMTTSIKVGVTSATRSGPPVSLLEKPLWGRVDARHHAMSRNSKFLARLFLVHIGITHGMTSKKLSTGPFNPTCAVHNHGHALVDSHELSPWPYVYQWGELCGVLLLVLGTLIVGSKNVRSGSSQLCPQREHQNVSCNVTIFSSTFHTNGRALGMTSWILDLV